MVEQLLDLFALIFATFVLRNPQQYFYWKPTSEDVDRIAEPTATMIARRPQLQNAVKRFAAPGMVGGGFAGYFMPRLFGLQLPQRPQRPQPQQQAPATAAHTEPKPAPTETAAATNETQARAPLAPEAAAKLSSAIGGLLDNIRSGIPN